MSLQRVNFMATIDVLCEFSETRNGIDTQLTEFFICNQLCIVSHLPLVTAVTLQSILLISSPTINKCNSQSVTFPR